MSAHVRPTIPEPPVKTRSAHVAIPADVLADAAIEDHRVFLPHATWADAPLPVGNLLGYHAPKRASGATGCVDDGKVVAIRSPEESLVMTTMMLELDDTKAQAFRERARSVGREPEQLLAEFIDQLLKQPGTDIDEATDYVLAKNRELYRRLA